MRYIDLQTWPRHKHYALFSGMDYPHMNLCAPVDITAFRAWIKAEQLPFTVTLAYLFAKVANATAEFRWRIRAGQVIEHAVVHPSMTLLAADDLFGFCTFNYGPSLAAFVPQAQAAVAAARANPTLEDGGRDDLLYMSSVPWVAFTGLLHPVHLRPIDSMPRITWGKFYAAGERWQMPLAVQAHHALMDGVHVGRFFEQVQAHLAEPARLGG